MSHAGSFIPITLEQLARDQGVLLVDKSISCRASFGDQLPSFLTSNVRSKGLATASPSHPDNGQCIINFLGIEINTASFAMYTFSISVLIQALLIISMSGAADHGNYRKRLLLAFAFTGALATMLFITVFPKIYLLGALLAIIANTCFGASFVLLNSFLPVIVRHHPHLQNKAQSSASTLRVSEANEESEAASDNEETDHGGLQDPLLTFPQTDKSHSSAEMEKLASPDLQLSTKISSFGIGIGYMAAVIVQTIAILIVVVTRYFSKSSTLPLRIALFFIGLWWFSFTIPAALWLRPRPGPPLSFTSEGTQIRSWSGYIAYAWQSLGKTVLRARHLKDVVLFLAAWFMLSDAIASISGTALLFAKTQLLMEPPALALINIIATLSGIVGAFSWRRLSRILHARPSQTIVACICLFEIIPLYGLLGFIPTIQRFGVFGLQQPWEMYPLGALYGFVLGGISSYCRSLFGELIPQGSEAAFYALYAITDKGSSIFGPAIIGAITDRYGQIRPAFVFLAVLIFLPLPLMMLVDVDRGRKDATAMARELAGRKELDASYASRDGTITLVDEETERLDDHNI